MCFVSRLHIEVLQKEINSLQLISLPSLLYMALSCGCHSSSGW